MVVASPAAPAAGTRLWGSASPPRWPSISHCSGISCSPIVGIVWATAATAWRPCNWVVAAAVLLLRLRLELGRAAVAPQLLHCLRLGIGSGTSAAASTAAAGSSARFGLLQVSCLAEWVALSPAGGCSGPVIAASRTPGWWAALAVGAWPRWRRWDCVAAAPVEPPH